jgi:hypothetical protein
VIDAHLSDFGASVLLRTVAPRPDSDSVYRQAAGHIIEIPTTLCVIWISQIGKRLTLVISDRGVVREMSHSRTSSSRELSKDFDAIASVVRATLMPWPEMPTENEQKTAAQTEQQNQDIVQQPSNENVSFINSNDWIVTPVLKAIVGYTI